MSIITEPGTKPGAKRALWRRLAWFVGLWTASVVGLGVVAEALRLVLHP